MNRNRQVTRTDYARCVEEQVAFLHEQAGSERPQRMITADGVSVDAAASDLFYRGV